MTETKKPLPAFGVWNDIAGRFVKEKEAENQPHKTEKEKHRPTSPAKRKNAN